jgi:hypothetical protein
MQKVSLYIRHNSSRQYEKLTSKAMFAGGNFPKDTIFVLRYVRDAKRCFETLKDCPNLKAAQALRIERELDLLRGTVAAPAPRLVPVTKPVAQKPSNVILMLDKAIDRYLEIITETKHVHTAKGTGAALALASLMLQSRKGRPKTALFVLPKNRVTRPAIWHTCSTPMPHLQQQP